MFTETGGGLHVIWPMTTKLTGGLMGRPKLSIIDDLKTLLEKVGEETVPFDRAAANS